MVGGDGTSPIRQPGAAITDDVDLTRPVERQVEARSADDVSGSIVRTLYFADTFLMSGLYTALCQRYQLYLRLSHRVFSSSTPINYGPSWFMDLVQDKLNKVSILWVGFPHCHSCHHWKGQFWGVFPAH